MYSVCVTGRQELGRGVILKEIDLTDGQDNFLVIKH